MAVKSYTENGKRLFEVYINCTDGRGRRFQRRKRGIDTLKKAEALDFDYKRELAKIREDGFTYRWSEWLEEAFNQMRLTLHPETVETYDYQLKKWTLNAWGNLEIKAITPAMVRELIFAGLGDKLRPSSRRSILKMIRRMFQIAVENARLDRNPCAGISFKVPEPDSKVLSNSEAEIFLREAKLTNHRFFPHWFLALKTGMRNGELLGLIWNDIDFEASMISVSKQWGRKTGFMPTKSQRSRVVPISEDLLQYLKELKLAHGKEREFVLPRSTEWEQGEQARITREFCTAIGITPIKFHDLRATFITNLLSRGVPLAQVMAVVGHSQLKTTNVYLRKAGVEVRGVTNHLGYKMPETANFAEVLQFKKASED
jgi:integrase